MGRAERTLYATARRIIRAHERAGIPFMGPAATSLVAWNLDPVDKLASWFRNPGHPTFEEGTRLLQRASAQCTLLQESEDFTRTALAEWAHLQRQRAWPNGQQSAEASAAACEAGMDLFRRQVLDITNPFALQSDVPEESREMTVDTLVETMRSKLPFSRKKISDNSASNEDNFRSLVNVFYEETKCRCEPFEWVYEGLTPALVPEAINHNRDRCTPAAVALTLSAVGRRLGLPLLPMPVGSIHDQFREGTDETTHSNRVTSMDLESLPPELALRITTRTQAGGPAPEPWLLRVHLQQKEERESEIVLDVAAGKILTRANAVEIYPGIAELSAEEWERRCVLRTWQGLSRLALQAHQRRGESDLVAHWLFIALALDPQATEWDRALTGPEVRWAG